jgi:hypothetical protein
MIAGKLLGNRPAGRHTDDVGMAAERRADRIGVLGGDLGERDPPRQPRPAIKHDHLIPIGQRCERRKRQSHHLIALDPGSSSTSRRSRSAAVPRRSRHTATALLSRAGSADSPHALTDRSSGLLPARVDQSADRTVSGAVVDHSRPNHRWIRLAPNSAFCAASSRDGPTNAPVRLSPKNVTSTRPTSLPPNSR